jgi:hypothetical protein
VRGVRAWILWNHRNRCVFDGSAPSVAGALILAGQERRLWISAGARGLSLLPPSLVVSTWGCLVLLGSASSCLLRRVRLCVRGIEFVLMCWVFGVICNTLGVTACNNVPKHGMSIFFLCLHNVEVHRTILVI